MCACVCVFVKMIDSKLYSVKSYMDQHCTHLYDISHVEVELLLSADKLPPNQRIVLLNLFEEVTDVLKEKLLEVDSVLECLENAEIAYQVSAPCSSVFNAVLNTLCCAICVM